MFGAEDDARGWEGSREVPSALIRCQQCCWSVTSMPPHVGVYGYWVPLNRMRISLSQYWAVALSIRKYLHSVFSTCVKSSSSRGSICCRNSAVRAGPRDGRYWISANRNAPCDAVSRSYRRSKANTEGSSPDIAVAMTPSSLVSGMPRPRAGCTLQTTAKRARRDSGSTGEGTTPGSRATWPQWYSVMSTIGYGSASIVATMCRASLGPTGDNPRFARLLLRDSIRACACSVLAANGDRSSGSLSGSMCIGTTGDENMGWSHTPSKDSPLTGYQRWGNGSPVSAHTLCWCEGTK